jgi:glutamate transport system permease protein
MTSSVLFDTPGPRTVRRHRIYGVVTALVILAIAALVLRKLDAEGQLGAERWDFLEEPGTWKEIRRGFTATLRAALFAVVLAIAFGAFFAAGRLSNRAWLRWPSVVVVEFFRAVPLLLLILFIFLGYGSDLGRFWALVLALVLYNGSVLAEIFRAGIVSVPKGQSEAAYALGLRKGQVTRIILMPQAIRTMLPAIVSQSVVALKDTALGFVIAYPEAVSGAKQIYVFYNNPLQAGLVVAAIYICINYALSKIAVILEARQRRTRRAPHAVGVVEEGLVGMEDQPGGRL